MQLERSVHNIAARQGGVILREQALHAGMSADQVNARLRTHRWTRVVNGCYRIFEMQGQLDLVRAAVAALPGAVASHDSAALIHGLGMIDTLAATVLVHSQTTHLFPKVRVYRCHDLGHDQVTMVDRIPTTTVARTVVDLASGLSIPQLGAVVDDAVAARRVEIGDIRCVLDSVARKGKPGVRSLRTILDERMSGDRSVSVLERAGIELLLGAGIDGFETEFPMPWSPNRRFDIAFVSDQVAIEWDSRRWHTQSRAFQIDRQRDREAVVHGWRVLRFTWDDVHIRGESVCDTIRAVLA